MELTDIITLFGGLALFLYGMNVMGDGLEKMSGGRLERVLGKMTSNLFKSVLLGTVITAVIQSSSATTVMLVGFVNAGIMKLTQVVGVIMGANIGTTATSWLLSLGDISSNNIIFTLLKPISLAPIMAVIGIILNFTGKGGRRQDLGQILLGFGVLFFGMMTMEQSMTGLKEMESFRSLMTTVSNPFWGVLVGALMTAVIQSSSASVGILQALSVSGAIRFNAAAPIILGQNIGTCVTALLSSIGASKNARRTAMIHLYFNMIGTVVFLIGLYSLQGIIHWAFWESVMDRMSIALFHLTFNLITTAMLLPFSKLLVKLAEATIRGKDIGEAEIDSVLDERFLQSPSVALDQAQKAVGQMMTIAEENNKKASTLLFKFEERSFDNVKENEKVLDKLEVAINSYLLRLTHRSLTAQENLKHSELMHTVGDLERIGDYAINIAEVAREKHKKKVELSAQAMREINALIQAVGDLAEMTFRSYESDDTVNALRAEPLEETVDHMTEVMKSRHIERLKQDACSPESGSVFLELLIHFERVADHCSNIALYLLQRHMTTESQQSFDIHAYAHHLHEGNSHAYREAFHEYGETYFSLLEDRPEAVPEGSKL